jgi:DEAD/DEAH box helicase domain-containing protein
LSFKPIAVFLDGYEYHKSIVHEDLLKRQALIRSGEYMVWSLTWQDVNQSSAANNAKIPNILTEYTESAPWPFINKAAESNGLSNHQHIAQLSPLNMLVEYLRQPNAEQWRKLTMLRALCWLDQKTMQDPGLHTRFADQTQKWPSSFSDTFPQEVMFVAERDFGSAGESLHMWLAGSQNAIRRLDSNAISLMVEIGRTDINSDVAQLSWQKFLQFLNVGQFLPSFLAVTKHELLQGGYVNLEWVSGTVCGTGDFSDDGWRRVASQAAEDVHEWLTVLKNSNVPLPEVGFELESLEGEIVAEAELAWPDLSVAVILGHQTEEGEPVFVEQGWKVINKNGESVDVLVKLLGDNR